MLVGFIEKLAQHMFDQQSRIKSRALLPFEIAIEPNQRRPVERIQPSPADFAKNPVADSAVGAM